MTDHKGRCVIFRQFFFQKADHRTYRPQIYPRIRFIVYGHFGIRGNSNRQLDFFDFTTRQPVIHFFIQKGQRTEANSGKDLQKFIFILNAGGNRHQITKRDTFESSGLLKAVCDTRFCPLSDRPC